MMDTAPLVATLTSLLAIGLSIALARMARQERRRSDARVAMLAALASAPTEIAMPAATMAVAAAPMTPARPVRLEPRARRAAAEVEIVHDPTFQLAPSPAHELFEPAPAAGSHSLLYVFAGAVVMAALIAFGFRWAVSAPVLPTTETTARITAPASEPLALVSLRHEQQADGTLVISGVVRNPVGASSRANLFVVASLIDNDGAFVASGRAPLDFTTLAPGDESPFVVRIAGATGVARYRVGFRNADDVAVGHLDKR